MAIKMLDGTGAATEAMRMARVQVISAYPITPQSPIAEKLSELVDKGELNAKYIRVESEHTAMSAAVGAQLTGVRACTATSSVGLILMHEVLGVASGCRLPIVMPVVNRALVSPWSLWCDHQDTMAVRESGWLQFYCENVQDAYDLTVAAYRIAEDAKVQTPAMVCQDGFFLSHSMQKVYVPDQELVDEFVGPYVPKNYILDTTDPLTINNLTPTDEFTEMRYQQKAGLNNVVGVTQSVFQEFEEKFGRHHAVVEGWHLEDAQAVIVTMGSVSGTVKYTVNKLREQGLKVGALKVVLYRPFPVQQVAQMLKGIPRIAVLDRSAALGAQGGPLWSDVVCALGGDGQDIRSYIAGLGGRDISVATIEKIFDQLLNREAGETVSAEMIDLKENPMELRRVMRNV